jgi:hypothetical protein
MGSGKPIGLWQDKLTVKNACVDVVSMQLVNFLTGIAWQFVMENNKFTRIYFPALLTIRIYVIQLST